jgi:hypothetical protein
MEKDDRIVNDLETLVASIVKAGKIAGREIKVDDLASALAKAPITTMATSLEAEAEKITATATAEYNAQLTKASQHRTKAAELRKTLAE